MFKLPRDSNPSESGSCIIPLFKDLTSDEICEPVCSTLTTPIVTQISEFEFHVLTADKHPLMIKCPRTQPLAISNIELGSDLINLPCECAMSYDKMTIVHPRLLCDVGTSHWTVKRAVPFAWSGAGVPEFEEFAEGINIPIVEREQIKRVEAEGDKTVLPTWIHDLVGAIVGAVVGTILAALAAVIKAWRRRRRASAVHNSTPREIEQQRIQRVETIQVPPRRYLELQELPRPQRRPPPAPAQAHSHYSNYVQWEDLD